MSSQGRPALFLLAGLLCALSVAAFLSGTQILYFNLLYLMSFAAFRGESGLEKQAQRLSACAFSFFPLPCPSLIAIPRARVLFLFNVLNWI